jgi:LPS-assembly protein
VLPALLADRIYINADRSLVAEGAVEILHGAQRLTATRLTYDPSSDRLRIEGPITVDDGAGSVFLADEADLSADLRDGLLTSARLVLDDQIQIAASEIAIRDGRYTELRRVAASSCQVCPTDPTPFWEIRASRVTHDAAERQLYYDNAQFRLLGLPVLYVPRLRMPDPTLDRANGVLMPSITSSSELGFGIRLPYFVALGDHRDLTFTPFVSTKDARALGLRYREALHNGTLQFDGAIGSDAIYPDDTRGYLFGRGRFALGQAYEWGFDLQTTSDDSYLLDYGISDADRLASDVFLTRTRRDAFTDARLTHYRSLRAGDDNDVLPSLEGALAYERRFVPGPIGGQARLRFDLRGIGRTSDVDFDANGDGVTDGRDVARLSLGADWRRQTVLANGMILGFAGALDANYYRVSQDASFPDSITRLTPTAAIDLRWPWVRPGRDGHSAQSIEPVLQLVWSPEDQTVVPNEDSALVEFDEGNLFSFSRFPGLDLYERGLRANLGLSWNRFDPDGWNLGVTVGRVLRAEDLGQFSAGSGLDGRQSDWLLAMRLNSATGLALTNRALFDDAFAFTKDELRLSFTQDRYWVASNFVWLVADPSEDRLVATSELAFAAGWKVEDNWQVTTTGRYDFEADNAVDAGLGLRYTSDCAQVDLSLSRRFTSSTSVRPTTEFNLSVALAGFGTGTDGRQYRKTCGG